MSLQIAAALRGGFDRLLTRTGAILILANVVVYVLYQASFNGALATVVERASPTATTTGLQPALGGPLWFQGLVVVGCLVAISYLYVVAIRTFVAEAATAFPEGVFTDGIAWALGNLVVGGLVYSVLYTVGLFLLVVPGLFVLVTLLFMPIYVADEGESFLAGFRHSWALTEGHRIELFGLMLVLLAVGGAFGFVVGFGSAVVAITGSSPALVGLVASIAIAPIALYGLAVTTDAYTQLREADREGFEGGTATSETPSTPA